MALNGEAIYGTRPWHVHGRDKVRFTTKGDTLYATLLEWPAGGTLAIKDLGKGAWGGTIRDVSLPGHGKVPFDLDAARLEVKLAAQRPCEHAWVLKMEGRWLTRVMP